MHVMGFDDFLQDFGRAAKPTMNMSIYQDSYLCGCGASHWFSGYGDIICEGLMKIMIHCPIDGNVINSLKIKTFMVVKFRGFENLATTLIRGEDDAFKLQALRTLVRSR